MNRILHYCYPDSLKDPKKYFYFEKAEGSEKWSLENLVKRYDGQELRKAMGMLEEVQNREYFKMIKAIAHKCQREFDYQYIYMGEQTPLL